MPGHFEPLPGGGAAVALDDVEISIIRSLAVQLLELIGPGPAEDASADPLAELFAEGPSEPPSDPVLKLTPEESLRWLGALNDLRLAIGARLEITDEDDSDVLFHLPDEDPRKPMVMAYLWLGGLQETLVSTLMP